MKKSLVDEIMNADAFDVDSVQRAKIKFEAAQDIRDMIDGGISMGEEAYKELEGMPVDNSGIGTL